MWLYMNSSKLPANLSIERVFARAADQKIDRAEQNQDRELTAAIEPKEAAGLRGEVHTENHEDRQRQRHRSREQAEHQQDAAEKFNTPDDRTPDDAGYVAEPVEQRRSAADAAAAEQAE